MAERDDDEENPWTDEDQAAYIAHIEDPLVYADIERREAEFLAWARTQSWAMTSEALIINRIASTVSQLSQVVGAPSRAANPAHHTQVGGSKDTESADSDSHVLAYHQHLKSLVIWTSALEIISANFTAAKSVQKYTHFLGNCQVDLADYPAGFTPDYTSSSSTILLAARLHGYLGDREQLYTMLDNDVTCRTLFQKFARQIMVPVTSEVIPEVDDGDQGAADVLPAYSDLPAGREQVDEAVDLSALARLRDPDGDWYRVVTRVAKSACRVWATDPVYGDDIVQDVITGTYMGVLRKYDHNKGSSVGSYAGWWARDSLDVALARLKITIPRRQVSKRLTLAEQVFARHADAEPAVNAPDEVKAAWDHHRRHLKADVDKYETTIGGRVVVSTNSLDAPLSDAEDGISVVDTLTGDDAGDIMGELALAQATAAVRECFGDTVLDGLIEKVQTVSTKTREDNESKLEYLARVAADNAGMVRLIKKTIGPSGLARLAMHI